MQPNPYVALGLPFGATPDEAQVAFARRARGLRRAPGGVDALQQLTRALNEVETIERDPQRALQLYRVPANPAALTPSGLGALRPPPEPMPRISGPSGTARAALELEAVREAAAAVAAEVAAAAHLPAR
jgi:hypothetical protein